jgi:hypothetical protein
MLDRFFSYLCNITWKWKISHCRSRTGKKKKNLSLCVALCFYFAASVFFNILSYLREQTHIIVSIRHTMYYNYWLLVPDWRVWWYCQQFISHPHLSICGTADCSLYLWLAHDGWCSKFDDIIPTAEVTWFSVTRMNVGGSGCNLF